jgi:hypothetical protein
MIRHDARSAFPINSKVDVEENDKKIYKEQYDIEQKIEYEVNLLVFDELIDINNKFDEEIDEKYQDECKKYENVMNIYLEKKGNNDSEILCYEDRLHKYEYARNFFIEKTKKNICSEFNIDYNEINETRCWEYGRPKKYTTSQEEEYKEIIGHKSSLLIEEYDKINMKPIKVDKLNFPLKPELARLRRDAGAPTTKSSSLDKYKEISYQLGREQEMWAHAWSPCRFEGGGVPSKYNINIIKKYYKDHHIKYYEKRFDYHYTKYRLHHYKNIINKYCDTGIEVAERIEDGVFEYQYTISIKMLNNLSKTTIFCELKPTMSDDYPCVLRKMNQQIELTINSMYNETKRKHNLRDWEPGVMNIKSCLEKNLYFKLIIGSFSSPSASREQLITIFKQSNIEVIFTEEIFKPSDSLRINCLNQNTERITNNALNTPKKQKKTISDYYKTKSNL